MPQVSGDSAGGMMPGVSPQQSTWDSVANYRPETPAGRGAFGMVNVPGALNALGGAYKDKVMTPLAEARHWAFTPDQQYAAEKAAQQPQVQAPAAAPPNAQTASLFGQSSTIPGAFIDYTKGLPQMGVARAEYPDAPDYTAVEQALMAAAPQIGSEARTTRQDAWLQMLPGFLAGLGSPGANFGQTLSRAAAGAATGLAANERQMKTEAQADEKTQMEYQRWLAANKMHMTTAQYQAAVQKAGFEQGVNNTQATLSGQNAQMMYAAQKQNAAQRQPQFHGDNLVTRTEDGGYKVQNTNPTSGMYMNMLQGGALPASAYSMSSVLANLPPAAVGAVMPMIDEISKDGNFLAMTGSLGGGKSADMYMLSKLMANLNAKAQAGDQNAALAVQEVGRAMAKAALMNKLPVK